MKLTKAQKEIYDRIVSDIEDYDKKPTSENLIEELQHQIEIELWHKDEYDESYSGLNIRVAKNLLKLLIAKKSIDKLLNDGQYTPIIALNIKSRGGKRKGAGRPKGTRKTVTKKMYSFRLSKDEEKAVRNLLKEMRQK